MENRPMRKRQIIDRRNHRIDRSGRGDGIAARFRVTEQALRKDMAKRQEMRLVEKRGSARAAYYVLNETVKITPPSGALVLTGAKPIVS